MANTLKFGNGEWYGKKDTILAYNDENSNYKPLPFDFSRASSATVINKDGLIETVGSGQPRIDYKDDSKGALKLEPSRTNLITYSSDFPRNYWTKNGASIQGDPSTLGSELVTNGGFTGGSTGWALGSGWAYSSNAINATSTSSICYQDIAAMQSNKTYTVTYQISNYSGGNIQWRFGGSGTVDGATRNANGTYTESFTNSSSGDKRLFLSPSGFTGTIDNVSIKEVQGFTSLDGTNNAWKLVGNGTNNDKVLQNVASGTSTFSIYAKAGNLNFTIISLGNGFAYYNIETGVVTSSSGVESTNVESIGNGWYRLSITVALTSSSNVQVYIASADGSVVTNNGDFIYLQQAQLEVGIYATSIIPTQGSAVTRLADVCNNSGNDQVINSTEGVLYAEIKALSEIGGNRYISLSDGTDSNRIILRFQDTNKVGCYVRSASGSDADITKTSASISLNFLKVAVKWKTNDVALWVNGVEVGVDSSFTTFNANVLNRLNLTGATTTISQYFYGNVKDLKVYNTALTDSELQALTS